MRRGWEVEQLRAAGGREQQQRQEPAANDPGYPGTVKGN
jgi:hypothetical protein